MGEQVIQQLYQHAPDARGFIMQYQLDTVLQDVVEQDESRLVQEQARVLLRAFMVSALI